MTNRLCQIAGNTELPGSPGIGQQKRGTEHYHCEVIGFISFPDAFHQLESVHLRHLVISKQESKGVALGSCLVELAKRLKRRVGSGADHSPTLQSPFEHSAIRLLVIYDQSPQSMQPLRRPRRVSGDRWYHLELAAEMKLATDPLLAFRPKPSIHH